MKKGQNSLRLIAGVNAPKCRGYFLVWGLSAAMISFAVSSVAGTPLGGGKKL